MSYSNGRIYTEETAGGKQIGVSIGDLMRCFGVVIRTTYDGVTDRRQSTDLGVIVAKRQGDSFYAPLVVDGVVIAQSVEWTVESRREMNPWARYRPIPCQMAENNVPGLITPAQRLDEHYGILPPVDMYTADTEAQVEDYADSVWDGSFALKLRPFGDTHWKRLADFVKTGEHGELCNGIGYDHNAQPDDVVVTISGSTDGAADGVHHLLPLIPEGQRDIYAPKGRVVRFQFPNDQLWVDEYYQYTKGLSNHVTKIDRHEEWLAPMDLVGANFYKHNPADITHVLRGVYVLKWDDSKNNDNGGWRFVNRVWNTVDKSSYSTEYNATTKGSFLDLTRLDDGDMNNIDLYMWNNYPGIEIDRNALESVRRYKNSSTPDSYSTAHDRLLWNLEGEYLFVEFWHNNASSQDITPIHGFCYTVRIYRDQIPSVSIDVPGIVEFLRVQTKDGGGDNLYLYFRVLTTELAKHSDGVLGVLKEYYAVLASATNVNNPSRKETRNLLTDYTASGAFNPVSVADGFTTFNAIVGQANDDWDAETEPVWTDTITARQKSATANITKTFNIDRSSLSE